jgi:uncharacterized coiled-coil protein SlyX
VSIETTNRIRELEERVATLEATVQQLLEQASQAKTKRETLSLKKLFNGSNG